MQVDRATRHPKQVAICVPHFVRDGDQRTGANRTFYGRGKGDLAPTGRWIVYLVPFRFDVVANCVVAPRALVEIPPAVLKSAVMLGSVVIDEGATVFLSKSAGESVFC